MNMTTSASCSIEPDSRRSASCGRLSSRCSTARLSWLSASTGTSSSLARVLSPRVISETSCTRFSWRDLPDGARSWRESMINRPSPGAQRGDGERGRVVDEEVQVLELVAYREHPVEVRAYEFALADLFRWNGG